MTTPKGTTQQEELEMQEEQMRNMGNEELLSNLLTISYHVSDAERMHNFEYARSHYHRRDLLHNEVQRRMDFLSALGPQP